MYKYLLELREDYVAKNPSLAFSRFERFVEETQQFDTGSRATRHSVMFLVLIVYELLVWFGPPVSWALLRTETLASQL